MSKVLWSAAVKLPHYLPARGFSAGRRTLCKLLRGGPQAAGLHPLPLSRASESGAEGEGAIVLTTESAPSMGQGAIVLTTESAEGADDDRHPKKPLHPWCLCVYHLCGFARFAPW